MLQPLSDDATPNEETGKTADPTEVASKSFPTSLRGYDQEEVRIYLRHIASALRDAQRREADMRSRLGKAVRRAEEASAKAGLIPDDELTDRLGSEVSRVIESARIAAEERTARSVAEAEALVERARVEAQNIRDEAEALLEERTAEAEAAATEIVADADAERAERVRQGDELYFEAQGIAREHLEQAVREGESIVAQAEVARKQILKEMDRRRRQMRMQVEQLKAARDRLLVSHGEMTRTLEEIAVELRQSVIEAKTKGDSAVRRIGESRFATPDEIEAEISDAAMIGRLDLPPIELRDELDIDAVVGASDAPADEGDDEVEQAAIRLPHADDADGPDFDGHDQHGPDPTDDGHGPTEITVRDATGEEIAVRDATGEEIAVRDATGEEIAIGDLVPEEGVLDSDDGFFITTVTAEHPVIALWTRSEANEDDEDDDYYGDDDLLAAVSPLFPDEDETSDDIRATTNDGADIAGDTDPEDTDLDPNDTDLDPNDTDLDPNDTDLDPNDTDPNDTDPKDTDREALVSDEVATADPDEEALVGDEVASDDMATEALVGQVELLEIEIEDHVLEDHVLEAVENTSGFETTGIDEETDSEEEVSAAIEAVLAVLPSVAEGTPRSATGHPSEGSKARSDIAPDLAPEDGVVGVDLTDEAAQDSDDSLATIFARIRVRSTEAVVAESVPQSAPRSSRTPTRTSKRARSMAGSKAAASSAPDERQPAVVTDEPQVVVEEPRDDTALVAMRDEAIRDLVELIGRRLKRVLMDEQNVVFEAAEREYGGPLIEIMPDKEHHVDLYLDAVFLQLQATYGAGAAFVDPDAKVRKLPRSFFEQPLAELVVAPLREALAQAVPVDAGVQTSQQLRSFYRSHKNVAVNAAAEYLALLAFGRGIEEAAGHGAPVRWVHVSDPSGCDAGEQNAAVESITVGERFPSGHLAPPITVGCRCILVPADR